MSGAPTWHRVKQIFQEALGLPAEQRPAFLQDACGEDSSLRANVESLLSAHAQAGSFAEPPVFDTPSEPAGPTTPLGSALMAGDLLGPYRITEFLAAGGMGEVYRAHDTKLGRDVAIKILPSDFTANPDRLARLNRESRILAALNHPNIATIYGIEDSGGIHAPIMELVEGPTLAERLAHRALPVRETLLVAGQIADALEAAHEKGIVHRDLKPANIKITPSGLVKVLDFGLAIAVAGEAASVGSQAPDITLGNTPEGVILGTAPYMSPEQIRGLPVDKRIDIWAFGCVVYEMLTGRRAFGRESPSDTIVAILEREPDWSALPSGTPKGVRRLLQRCLTKDAKHRLRDIGDAQLDLNEADSPTAAPSTNKRSIVVVSVATVAVALAAGLMNSRLWHAPVEPSAHVARFTLRLSPQDQFTNLGRQVVAISPQGTHVVYSANGRLFIRALDKLESVPVAGTEGNADNDTAGRSPFFSPDGQWIGFWQRGQLKKVALNGGPPLSVSDVPNPWGVSWASDDHIYFGQDRGIWRVAASGGAPEKIVEVNPGSSAHGPQLLPDGDTILFTVARGRDWENAEVIAYTPRSQTQRVVLRGGSDARYVPTGHLLYAREGAVFAAPFDPATSKVTGESVAVLENVAITRNATATAHFATSAAGSLVYLPSSAIDSPAPRRTLVWVDRFGKETALPAPPRAYTAVQMAPNGRSIALDIRDQDNDIWIFDLTRGTLTRLTTSEGQDRLPIWATDGQRVFFASNRSGRAAVYSQRADGIEAAELVGESRDAGGSADGLTPTGVTPDGKQLIVAAVSVADRSTNVGALRIGATTNLEMLVKTSFNESNGVVSRDGRWLAYDSDASGQREVFVRPFPNVAGGQWQVSVLGGVKPLWARDGSELFYWNPKGALMRVAVDKGSEWAAGAPKQLIGGNYFFSSGFRTYDVSPDGQRFLMIKPSEVSESAPPTMILVQNWFEELKHSAPTN